MTHPLFQAIERQNIDEFKSRLSEIPDVNQRLGEKPSWRPLEFVIEQGVCYDAPASMIIEMVQILIQKGADVNFWNNDEPNTWTPLLSAICWPNLDLVRVLLKAGADPNIANEDGRSPLMLVVNNSDIETAMLLLGHGAGKTINVCDRITGWSVLHRAAHGLHIPMIKLLIEAGADPALKSKDAYDDRIPQECLPSLTSANSEQWDTAKSLLTPLK